MADFNLMYTRNARAWGKEVSEVLVSALKYAIKGKALDLGCAQGKEVFLLAEQGFEVEAVDSSDVAINQVKQQAKQKKLSNVKAYCSDVAEFNISEDGYDLIIAFNVLYFLEIKSALRVIDAIKKGLRSGGVVALSLFTVKDFFYNESKKHRFYVESDQVKKLFKDFEILEYYEGIIYEEGHESLQQPHHHGVVRIVARKI